MAPQLRHAEITDPAAVRVVMASAALLFVSGFALQSLSFALPALEGEWAIDMRLFGVLLSAAVLGQMAGYIALAPLADVLGPRCLAVVGCLALAAMLALSAMATSFEMMLATRVLTGLAIGGVTPAAVSAVVATGSPRWQVGRVIIVYTALPLGFATVAFVSGAMIAAAQWRLTFALGAGSALLLASFLWRVLPRRRPASTRNAPFAAIPSVLREYRHATLMLWGVCSVGLGLYHALQGWMPILIERAGLSFETAAMATALFGVGAGLAAVPAIIVMRHLTALVSLIVVGVQALLGIFMLALSIDTGETILVLATSFVTGMSVGGIQKIAVATATLLYPPAARATGLALALGIGRGSAAVSPFVIGLVATLVRPEATILILAIPIASMIVALVWFRRRYGRDVA